MALLSDYEVQVADVLHDPLYRIWSSAQIDRYVNDARRQLVKDTACLRTLQTTYLTQGVEAYTFGSVTGGVVLAGGANYVAPTIAFSGGGGSGVAATLGVSGGAVNTITFTNFGSGYTSAPSYVITDATGTGASLAFGVVSANTYDVLDVNVQWGNMRYQLEWRPWSVFSRQMRQWTASSYQRQPVMWAVYGNTQVYIGPPPDTSYPVELDSVVLPVDLVGSAVDVIPALLQDPIKFYAAYLAKLNNQDYGESEMLLSTYRRVMLECNTAYVRRIPNGGA